MKETVAEKAEEVISAHMPPILPYAHMSHAHTAICHMAMLCILISNELLCLKVRAVQKDLVKKETEEATKEEKKEEEYEYYYEDEEADSKSKK